MIYTLDHVFDSSVYLWLDHVLIEYGRGFGNYTGSLKPVSSSQGGLSSYAFPHRQLVYDYSVSGSIVASGVYVTGTFQETGASLKIDNQRGQALFTASQTQVSGAYSYKEVNIYETLANEQEVLFETKFVINPRSQPASSNYTPQDVVYPCIFIKSSAGNNKTLCFDGCAETIIPVRLMFLADSLFLYKAVTSILRDRKETHIPIFNASELPFDKYYSLKAPFDYTEARNAPQAENRLAYVKDVSISDFKDKVNNSIGPRNLFGGFIDIDFQILRFPHAF